MAISITWSTKVIYVPKNDMTLVQASPTEIRSLDLNWFRLQLRSLEDDEEGMPFDITHNHVAPIDVGGITLARVVEIINDYTVTFEDGQYAVNLTGANTNLADRVNVNQVSVRSSNSAGLVTSAAIEYGEYGGAVTIDPINGVAGSVYPIGTLRMPSNNVTDAMVIANARGFNTLVFLKNITLDTGDDVRNMLLTGVNPVLTTLTVNTGALTDNCSIKHCTLQGTLDNNTTVEKAIVRDVLYYNGEMRNCTLQGTIVLGGGASASIIDCVAGVSDGDPPTIDMGGSGQSLAVRNYNGELTLINRTGTDACSINMNAGHLILDSTVMAGDVYVEGTAKITDNSDGTALVHMDSVQVAESAYNEFVFIDTSSGLNGDIYPYGISTRPVSSLSNALSIASNYNLKGLSIRGTIILGAENIQNFALLGRGVVTGSVIVASGQSLSGVNLKRLTITGAVAGSNTFYEDCILSNVSGLSGLLISSVLAGTIYINGIVQSRSTTLASTPTIISFANNTSSILQLEVGSGQCQINGMTSASLAQVRMDSGSLTIHSSCTGGLIRVSGDTQITDNSNGAVTIVDNTLGTELTDRIWDEQRSSHNLAGSFGATSEWAGQNDDMIDMMERIKGLVHENIFIDNMEFDTNGQLLSSRIRLFDTKSNCNLATDGGDETEGLIAEYTQTSPWAGIGRPSYYKQVRD